MFRLPVCPHCHTVYSYGEVLKNKKRKNQCYHCKKEFRRTRFPGYLLLGLIVLVITVLVNISIMGLFSDIKTLLITVFIISVIEVFIAIVFTPFFIRYIKIKK